MIVRCDDCGSDLSAKVRDKVIEVEPCEACKAEAVEGAKVGLDTLGIWCAGCGDDLAKEEHADGKGLTIGLCERCKKTWVREGELGALELLG